jgi:hypothetical protein
VTGLAPSDDTFIQADNPGTNFGGENSIEVRPDNGADRRGLVRFDLSSIPSNAVITSANLYLYAQDKKQGTITNIYRVTSNWSENSATWNTPWTTPGGDFNSSIAHYSFISDLNNCLVTLDILDLVQAWVSGTYPNYGVMLYATGPNHTFKYTSKEDGTVQEHPRLQVIYTLPMNTPTPTPTLTPNLTSTATATPVNTPIASETPTVTPTPTMTFTPSASPTPGLPACVDPFTVNGRLPSDDTYIDLGKAADNFGAETKMEVRPDNGADRRGLVRFDLSDIPAGATITSATLYLFPIDEKTGQTTYLYRVTSSWTELTASWNSPWTTPGGDFDPNVAYASYLNQQKNCSLSLDFTSLVQQWVNGTYPNYGLLLFATGPNHTIQYQSKEKTDKPEEAPRLSITFTTGASRDGTLTRAFIDFFDWLGRNLSFQ